MDKRATYHEGGHTIAAVTLGLRVITVTIEGGRPHLLRDRFRQQRSLAAEAVAIVCLSGPAAETMFFGLADDGGDHIDRQMARGYLHGYYRDAEVELQMVRMSQAAERLVISERTKIETVAAALLRHGTLTGDQIIELTETKVSASLFRA
jgi:hypothetical protein